MDLSTKELKAIAKILKAIKDELLRALTSSKLVKKVKKQKQIFLKQE